MSTENIIRLDNRCYRCLTYESGYKGETTYKLPASHVYISVSTSDVGFIQKVIKLKLKATDEIIISSLESKIIKCFSSVYQPHIIDFFKFPIGAELIYGPGFDNIPGAQDLSINLRDCRNNLNK